MLLCLQGVIFRHTSAGCKCCITGYIVWSVAVVSIQNTSTLIYRYVAAHAMRTGSCVVMVDKKAMH